MVEISEEEKIDGAIARLARAVPASLVANERSRRVVAFHALLRCSGDIAAARAYVVGRASSATSTAAAATSASASAAATTAAAVRAPVVWEHQHDAALLGLTSTCTVAEVRRRFGAEDADKRCVWLDPGIYLYVMTEYFTIIMLTILILIFRFFHGNRNKSDDDAHAPAGATKIAAEAEAKALKQLLNDEALAEARRGVHASRVCATGGCSPRQPARRVFTFSQKLLGIALKSVYMGGVGGVFLPYVVYS